MRSLPPALAATIALRSGVVTVEELADAGVRGNTLRRDVTAGVLRRVHRGVYHFTTSPFTFDAACIAACLADAEAMVTGPAGARLWGFHHVYQPQTPIVAVSHDRSPLGTGVLVRRTNVLEPSDWVRRSDGIRLANPARTWFDCARDLSDERFERLTEWVIDHHASIPTLWGMRARLNSGGRPGLARVNRVLSQRSTWQRPVGSGLELKVLNALEASGVHGLVRQYAIRLPDGIVVHPDGALPDLKWAVEIDHVTWHGGRFDAQRDKGRDRKLRRIGWQVERVTDQEVRESFAATIAELVEMVALRRASAAA